MNHADMQNALEHACRTHRVPGASAAFFDGDGVTLAVFGVANLTTGVEMTTDTLMHVGSITKVINATLLMQLVDEGAVELSDTVVEWLPDFCVRDREATRAMTLRMLIDHTAGIDGDLLPDSGHDGETLARTIRRFAELGQIHRPGYGRSYCNPGTVVAGQVCARLRNERWYRLIRARIFEPLAMHHAVVLPEDAVLFRSSVGHFLGTGNAIRRTSHAFLPLGYAPAGSTAMMTAGDLMTFVRAHLGDGRAPNGSRVLSSESAARMRVRSETLGGPEAFDSGLGWRRNGEFVMHGGGGPGIVALVVAHPPTQTAAVVLTNAEHGSDTIADSMRPFFEERTGVDLFPAPPLPTGERVDVEHYIGIYESINTVHEVESVGGELAWASWSTQKYYDSSPMEKPAPTPLIAVGKDRFLADSRVSTMPSSESSLIWFAQPGERGKMQYLAENFWIFPRKDGSR